MKKYAQYTSIQALCPCWYVHTFVHIPGVTYVCTSQEPTPVTHTLYCGGYWHMHSLYGQFQFGVLWVVDHIRLHFNLPWETIEVICDLALGLVIIPLILQTKPGEEGEGGRGRGR